MPGQLPAFSQATATLTTAPRSRKMASVTRRRLTRAFYDAASRRQPHSGQPWPEYALQVHSAPLRGRQNCRVECL